MRSRPTIAALMVLVLLLVALTVHVLGIWPSPAETADRLVADMVQKGVQLSNDRRMEMREDLYSMFVFHRWLDIALALLVCVLAFAIYRRNSRLAVVVAVLYGILNLAFLVSAWDVPQHGITKVAASIMSQVSLHLQTGAFDGVLFKLSRPFTLVFGLVLAAALFVPRLRASLMS